MAIRVLAVDDDSSVLRVLDVMFRRWDDLALDSAMNGADALEKLADASYGLVISDVEMPRIDGLRLLETIRARFPDLPVVLLSGTRDPEAPARARGLGARDFLAKPVRARDLRSAIDSAIRGRMATTATAQPPAAPPP